MLRYLFSLSFSVPQGSHLGPQLLILCIKNAELIIHSSSIQVYADDMKIYRVITSFLDSYPLQNDLNIFSLWCH